MTTTPDDRQLTLPFDDPPQDAEMSQLTGTARKLQRFDENCLHDPAPVHERVKTLLARGANWSDLVDEWNTGSAQFLVEAGIDRKTAIRIVIDRVISGFRDRDAIVTSDAARFVRALSNQSHASKLSLRKILARIEKLAGDELARGPILDLEKERRAQKVVHQLEWQESQISPKSAVRIHKYPNTQNSEYRWLKPAEILELNRGLDGESATERNRYLADIDDLACASRPNRASRRPQPGCRRPARTAAMSMKGI